MPVRKLALIVCLLLPAASAQVDIEALIASMTLDEKVGQMTMAERSSASPADVRNFFLGSILSGGGSAPASNTPTGWADMHDAYQNEAANTRLGIPILYGIDAVHGHNNVVGATIFPHNIGLGATRDPNLLMEIGRITALEVACTGLEWTFAPTVAVSRDERWGRSYESYGEDPGLQTLLVGPFVFGLQGTTLDGQRVVACAKHFIGDGGTSGGIDRGNTVLSEADLRSIHLPGFIEALAQDVATVMPSYSSWNGVKMHEHAYLINDVLKTELGFDGFVISDWEAVYELSGGSYYDQVVQMVNAGVDMGMEPFNWQNWITTVKAAVQNGDISMTRIDDAVRRILTVKQRANVFNEPLADRSLVNSGLLGSAAHRAVAREAVRKSMVLLKNNGVLPLSKNASVFVAGKNANNLGYQCGGWSISWQGGSGNTTPGTTILQGIQAEVAAGGGSVTFNEAGFGSGGHDVAIVVIGETPYAEWLGDNSTLALDGGDLSVLGRIDPSVPTVVVMVSGRPLMVTNELNNWDAFVAAWLPGTEGDGVGEVLFGDYDFVGKLPVSWPANIGQLPINVGDAPYAPLYPYGYGLDYTTQAPSVTITSPSDGAFLPGGNILLQATASDADGNVASVTFLANGNVIGTDTAAPYSLSWNGVSDGCYTLQARATDNDGLQQTDTIQVTVGAGCGGQTPFGGTAWAIPGLIQAEDYDEGGPTIAYQDSDPGNNGGSYRPSEQVDIEPCVDAGGGFNVGWMSNNEWIEYTTNVTETGLYGIDIRVASQTTGGNFSLEMDGVNVTGNISVPATGDWQNWTTIASVAQLDGGAAILRFQNANSGDEYNVNYFDFVLLSGDFDQDGDRDQADALALAGCMTGPDVGPLGGNCDLFDYNADNDVDMADVAAFQRTFGN